MPVLGQNTVALVLHAACVRDCRRIEKTVGRQLTGSYGNTCRASKPPTVQQHYGAPEQNKTGRVRVRVSRAPTRMPSPGYYHPRFRAFSHIQNGANVFFSEFVAEQGNQSATEASHSPCSIHQSLFTSPLQPVDLFKPPTPHCGQSVTKASPPLLQHACTGMYIFSSPPPP